MSCRRKHAAIILKILSMQHSHNVVFNRSPLSFSLQVCFFSATLHSPQIRELAERICVNPVWVDLKGGHDGGSGGSGGGLVPETVHHVVLRVDPVRDYHRICSAAAQRAVTDDIHSPSIAMSSGNGSGSGGGGKSNNATAANITSREAKSQRVKEMKQHMLVQLIDKYNVRNTLMNAVKFAGGLGLVEVSFKGSS